MFCNINRPFYLMLNAFMFPWDAAGYGCNSCNDDATTITYNRDNNHRGGRTLWGSDSWDTMTGTIIIHPPILSPPWAITLLPEIQGYTCTQTQVTSPPQYRAHPKSIILLLLDLLVVQVTAATATATATVLGLTMGMTTMLSLGRLMGMMKFQFTIVI